MDEQADFTFGQNFTDLPAFVRESLSNGLRFIPILDPAINTEKENYAAHTNAMASKVYITWYNDTLQPNKNCTASPGDCQPLDNVMLGYVIRFGQFYYWGKLAHSISHRCGPLAGRPFPIFSNGKRPIGGVLNCKRFTIKCLGQEFGL